MDSLPPVSTTGLHSSAKAWTAMVREVMDELMPLRPATKTRPVPWWTGELDAKRRRLLALHARLRHPRRGTFQLEQTFVRRRREYKQLIRKAKRESWRSFCSTYNSVRDVSTIVRAVKPKAFQEVGLILDQTGNPPDSPEDSIINLLKVHFPNGDVLSPDDPSLSDVPQDDGEPDRIDDNDDFDGTVSLQKLKTSIASFSSYKAAGPDEIAPCVLQHLPEEAVEYLRVLFVRSLRQATIPEVWRQMRVVFIPKPGKPSYNLAKSFRPITLSSFVLKTLERLLQWHLQANHLDLNPLPSQHAYTTGLSTETALSEAVDFIESAVYNKQYALAVSLDCSGAFDNISFDSAEQALEHMGVRHEITR